MSSPATSIVCGRDCPSGGAEMQLGFGAWGVLTGVPIRIQAEDDDVRVVEDAVRGRLTVPAAPGDPSGASSTREYQVYSSRSPIWASQASVARLLHRRYAP